MFKFAIDDGGNQMLTKSMPRDTGHLLEGGVFSGNYGNELFAKLNFT